MRPSAADPTPSLNRAEATGRTDSREAHATVQPRWARLVRPSLPPLNSSLSGGYILSRASHPAPARVWAAPHGDSHPEESRRPEDSIDDEFVSRLRRWLAACVRAPAGTDRTFGREQENCKCESLF